MKWHNVAIDATYQLRKINFRVCYRRNSLIPPFISVPGLGENVAKRIVDA